MKKRFVLLLSVFCVVSVAAFAADTDLVGTWKVDTLKIMQMMGQTPPPGTDPEELAKQFSITIEMTKGGVWKYVTKTPNGEQSQEGNWKVLSTEGDTVTIETSDATGQTQEFVLTFENKDSVVATVPNGPKMFLERVK